MRGWTQAQLAEHLGVHQKTIVNWESTGVPPRSEYKVRRVLPQELRYIDYVDHIISVGSLPASFEEWVEYDKAQIERLEESNLSDEQIALDEIAENFELEERQSDYDSRIARLRNLSVFTSDELLNEVSRRIHLLEAEVRNVPDLEDDIPTMPREEEQALRQSSHGLAAKRGRNEADVHGSD